MHGFLLVIQVKRRQPKDLIGKGKDCKYIRYIYLCNNVTHYITFGSNCTVYCNETNNFLTERKTLTGLSHQKKNATIKKQSRSGGQKSEPTFTRKEYRNQYLAHCKLYITFILFNIIGHNIHHVHHINGNLYM